MTGLALATGCSVSGLVGLRVRLFDGAGVAESDSIQAVSIVGCGYGAVDGMLVGAETGIAVGSSVGAFDGTLVGAETGIADGSSAGTVEGLLVGAEIGRIERASTVTGLALATGCSVGGLVGLLVCIREGE